jgi:adenine-specific DNA methylase
MVSTDPPYYDKMGFAPLAESFITGSSRFVNAEGG